MMLQIKYPIPRPYDFRCFDFPLYAYVKHVSYLTGRLFEGQLNPPQQNPIISKSNLDPKDIDPSQN